MALADTPYSLRVFLPTVPQQHTQIYIKPGPFAGTGERARLLQEIEEWCRNVMGPEDIRWSHPTTRSWLFVDAGDAMLFKLRWTP